MRYSLSTLLAVVTCLGVTLGALTAIPWRKLPEIFELPSLGFGMVVVFLAFLLGGILLCVVRN